MTKEAQEHDIDVGIELKFEANKVICRKRHFDEDVEINDKVSQSPKKNFRVTFFIHIIGQVLHDSKTDLNKSSFMTIFFEFLLIA